MSRFPFTDAYDFIREQTAQHSVDHDMVLPSFSRSQVAQIVHAIAPALEMTPESLAVRIANHAKASKGATS